ncbi:MAG: DUF2807 domain-containing protein [Leptolyngbya sp. SIO3F4]|nr:DUF2807 domain-containing protein [Leptolyngbya sp. SIO3F4]
MLAVLLSACEPENSLDCFKFHRNTERETRTVTAFERIEVNDKIDVVLRQGPDYRVEVEYARALLPEITVEVSENTLILRNTESCRFVRNQSKRPTVYVQLPKLTSLTSYGTGTIIGETLFESDTLDIDAWAGGEQIVLNVAVDKLLARIHAGTCDMRIGGTTDELFIFQRGQGFMYLQDLRVRFAVIDHAGAGDAHVHIEDDLDYTLGFLGNLFLSGNPQIGRAEVTDEGRLYRVN